MGVANAEEYGWFRAKSLAVRGLCVIVQVLPESAAVSLRLCKSRHKLAVTFDVIPVDNPRPKPKKLTGEQRPYQSTRSALLPCPSQPRQPLE